MEKWLRDRGYNTKSIQKQILKDWKHYRNDLLEREKQQMSKQKLTFKITSYPEEQHIVLTPNKTQKLFPYVPVTGFRKGKCLNDYLVRVTQHYPNWMRMEDVNPNWVRVEDVNPNWMRMEDVNPSWVRVEDVNPNLMRIKDVNSNWMGEEDVNPYWIKEGTCEPKLTKRGRCEPKLNMSIRCEPKLNESRRG